MFQIFRTKKRYAKKSLAKRIKDLNSVSKTHVQQDSSCSKGTLPMADDNTTPPLGHKMSNNLKNEPYNPYISFCFYVKNTFEYQIRH